MKRRKNIIHFLFLSVFLNFNSCSNSMEPSELKPEYQIIASTFFSAFVGDSIRLDISLPAGYNSDTEKVYKTVYLTDGYWRRNEHDTFHQMGDKGEIPEIIVVGIGYPDGYDCNNIRVRDLVEHPDLFLSCIKEEVIPFVEEKYRADSLERTLWGSSYGGHFLFYTFTEHVKQGSLFNNYICASVPLNLPYTHFELIEKEEQLWNSSKLLPVNLYITVGGNETQPFINSYNEIVRAIESHPYTNFYFEHEIIPDTDHYSVWKPTVLNGLKMFLNR